MIVSVGMLVKRRRDVSQPNAKGIMDKGQKIVMCCVQRKAAKYCFSRPGDAVCARNARPRRRSALHCLATHKYSNRHLN